MEAHVPFPQFGHTFKLWRCSLKGKNKRGVFSHELCHRGASNSFPQPSMAPRIAHSVYSNDGGVVVLVLLAGRATHGFWPRD